jgi:Putative auto-transporter adhesin, head GIN domain
MRRFTLPLVVLASVAIAALLTWIALSSASFGQRAPRTEAAAALVEPVTRALPAFAQLDVSGTAEVMLVQGTAESVSIATDGRKHGRIDAEVRDGTLFVQSTDGSRWWDMVFGGGSGRAPHVVVTFRDLTDIDAAGTVKLSAGALRADDLTISGAGGTAIRIGDLTARTLRLAGAGALKAELAGRVTDQTVTISGAGEYLGGQLASQNATVTVAGAGQVVVKAEKTLKASISGAGSVEYIGDPQVTERISGAGRVRRRDA